MNKQMVYFILFFLIFCAICFTYIALRDKKKNYFGKMAVCGYFTCLWLCIIVVTCITILY